MSGRELVTEAPASWLRVLLPDYRVLSSAGWHPGQLAGHIAWSLVLAAVLLISIRRTRSRTAYPDSPTTPLTDPALLTNL